MKKCLKCNIVFDTNRFTCPFCKGNLSETNESVVGIVSQEYPKFNKKEKKTSFILKLFIFLTVISVFISAMISFISNEDNAGFHEFLIVVSSLIVCWSFIKGVILSKKNFALRIICFAFSLIALFMIIEYNLGSDSWVLNYMLSFILALSLLTITFALLIKVKRFKNYISLLILLCFINCIPIILYRFDFISVKWPAFSACCCGAAVLFGMIIFGYKEMLLELRKRFNA